MITYMSRRVWPSADEYPLVAPDVRDLAVGLGRIPRFAGQTRRWYPVLAHVLVVAAILPEPAQACGLLHDAPEAIVGDVPTTWKTDEAKALEAGLLVRIRRSLGLPALSPWAGPLREADRAALHAEAHVLGHGDPSWFDERYEWTPLTEQAKHLTDLQLGVCDLYLDARFAMATYGRALDAALQIARAAA